MSFSIALAGNPNSGKTTLFNALTGSNQKVGNWPGVTVDKKEGKLKGHKDIIIEDLPGIYSLSPYTMEEVVSRRYLIKEKPDLIVNLVDGSNLIRNLYLTSQLLELGIPTIIALNMMDIVKANGDYVDRRRLSELLGVEVVEIIANREDGLDDLKKAILKAKDVKSYPHPLHFSPDMERGLSEIRTLFSDSINEDFARFYSIKAFEDDKEMIKDLDLSEKDLGELEKIRQKFRDLNDDDVESIITTERYDALSNIEENVLKRKPFKRTRTDKIDDIVTSKYLGLPIFALVMFVIYYLSIATVGTFATDAVNGFFEETFAPFVGELLASIDVNEAVIGLVTDGIIGGVGAVLGFLPQMVVLFTLLSLLEDIGYMSRVAFVMDKVFRSFGLSGKSFIPIMISTGCGVPGIQASRTIENDRDRRITIMTATFMPCSAKLPVIAMISGAFFASNQALITFSFYMIGIASVIVSGLILKKFKTFASKPAPFVMELPEYHMPRPKSVIRDVYSEAESYVKRAGSIILLSTVIIWFLSNFSFSLQMVGGRPEDSILAKLGSLLALVFRPLGFGSWQASVATISGFVAKENVVSTLGVLLNTSIDQASSTSLLGGFNLIIGDSLAGYSFLLFNMLCMPCFAAVGAIKTEMNDMKWTLATVGYQMGFAYVLSLIVYNLGRFFQYGSMDLMVVFGFIMLIVMVYLIFRKDHYKMEEAYSLT
ncbi:MAG: ferrous iron transport protein B [Anaerococcus sp.]|nr:ferrous iron transport protein B [Anaerococcus sp.]